MDDIDYKIFRQDEKRELRVALIATLAERQWLGYRPKVFHQQFVEQVLKRRIVKLTHYLYTRGLCHITFLSQVTERELKEMLR